MAAFRKQLEAIKVSLASAGGGGAKGTAAAQPAAEEPVDEDSERLAQISELESQIAKTKRLKLGDELVQAQETRLAALRAERMAAKAPQAQVAALSSRLGRLQAKQEKLRLATEDKQKGIEEAQTALDQAKADLEAHQTDIANTASAIVAVQAELRQAMEKAAPEQEATRAPVQVPPPEVQKEVLAEVLRAHPQGASLAAGGGGEKVLGELLGQILAKLAAAPGPPGPAASGPEAQPPDEEMPDVLDDGTVKLIQEASRNPEAKRALATTLRDLRMVKKARG